MGSAHLRDLLASDALPQICIEKFGTLGRGLIAFPKLRHSKLMRRARHFLLLIVVSVAIASGAWAFLRVKALKRQALRQSDYLSNTTTADADLWTRSMEKVKEARGEAEGAAVETPPELRHYSDRHWFLATQVAEVRKFNVQSCQDFVDLAAMIQRGELVSLPAVTDTYILYGVGAKAEDGVFSRYQDGHNIELYDEPELRDAYGRLESTHSKLETEISRLKTQTTALKKGDRAKQVELQKEITARQQELKANEDDKALLDQSYGQPETRQRLLSDYASLQALAKNFGGRSYNLNDSSDRQAIRVSLLSTLKPEALKILEEIAKSYHDKFDRPLPVSSLVRPEQYQHTLNRVNRNAVLIDTPPHTTGLAFDIDYRYMSGAEQNFLMTELARMKGEGRIEVIRERNANFHIFAFIDGRRPDDELITASLDEATLDKSDESKETNHATNSPATGPSATKTPAKVTPAKLRSHDTKSLAKVASKSRTAKKTKTNSNKNNRSTNSRAKNTTSKSKHQYRKR